MPDSSGETIFWSDFGGHSQNTSAFGHDLGSSDISEDTGAFGDGVYPGVEFLAFLDSGNLSKDTVVLGDPNPGPTMLNSGDLSKDTGMLGDPNPGRTMFDSGDLSRETCTFEIDPRHFADGRETSTFRTDSRVPVASGDITITTDDDTLKNKQGEKQEWSPRKQITQHRDNSPEQSHKHPRNTVKGNINRVIEMVLEEGKQHPEIAKAVCKQKDWYYTDGEDKRIKELKRQGMRSKDIAQVLSENRGRKLNTVSIDGRWERLRKKGRVPKSDRYYTTEETMLMIKMKGEGKTPKEIAPLISKMHGREVTARSITQRLYLIKSQISGKQNSVGCKTTASNVGNASDGGTSKE
jgi:hypothetical protein